MTKTQHAKEKARRDIVDMLSGMYTHDCGLMKIVDNGLAKMALSEVENLRILIQLATNNKVRG